MGANPTDRNLRKIRVAVDASSNFSFRQILRASVDVSRRRATVFANFTGGADNNARTRGGGGSQSPRADILRK